MVVVESKLSDQLWLSFSLALAKPNKRTFITAVCHIFRNQLVFSVQLPELILHLAFCLVDLCDIVPLDISDY